MQKGKKSAKSAKSASRPKQKLSQEALDRLQAVIESFEDEELQAQTQGRFCYLFYSGAPLCRLGYQGDANEWEFAIYRNTIGKYSNGDYFLPSRAPVDECIRTALSFYNLR